ncbi:MAG: four helix bundle protein [Bacteroidales bacterium]|nr:four helix bundle protein [Bacteroidales bacterium]
MHNFRELKIWQKSRELVKHIYLITKSLPQKELFGLTSQIRRASTSIPSNVAEGCGRQTDKELIRFFDITNGSAFELETLLLIASDLNYINKDSVKVIIYKVQEIEKMIFNLKKYNKES